MKKKILLVSNSKFNLLAEELLEITIGRLIIDEVDSINIPNATDCFDAKYYYLISSSIQNIFNGYARNYGFIKQLLQTNYVGKKGYGNIEK